MSPGRTLRASMRRLGSGRADAGGGDVHAVGLAALDDFGIAAYHRDAGAAQRTRHGAHLGFENGSWKAFFEHKSDDHGVALGPGDGKIVHGAIYGKLADGAAGKAQWLHDETIGGDGDRCAVDLDAGGIAQRLVRAAEQQRREQSFDKPAAGLAAGAVRHLDLRIAEADRRPALFSTRRLRSGYRADLRHQRGGLAVLVVVICCA